MKKNQVFTDEHGVRWITPARVADIWNEIAESKHGITANYTRWSVFARRDEIPYLDTPLGRLFREDKAVEAPLRPRSTKRADTAKRNKQRSKKSIAGDGNAPMMLMFPGQAQPLKESCFDALIA